MKFQYNFFFIIFLSFLFFSLSLSCYLDAISIAAGVCCFYYSFFYWPLSISFFSMVSVHAYLAVCMCRFFFPNIKFYPLFQFKVRKIKRVFFFIFCFCLCCGKQHKLNSLHFSSLFLLLLLEYNSPRHLFSFLSMQQKRKWGKGKKDFAASHRSRSICRLLFRDVNVTQGI